MADARGCIDLGSPCEEGQGCDEERDACGLPAWCTEGRDGCIDPGDCDGDGELAMECGGADCDDEDSARYPGNPEVCDAANVDEDCDPATFGARDRDMDGFIDAVCCNVQTDASLLCGDDCDDGLLEVRPGGEEVCNSRDDDCDSSVDEEPMAMLALCPGGMCVGGRCSFTAWDRTIASTILNDYGESVGIDAAGNIYVLGTFEGSINVGGMTYDSAGQSDVFVMSYGADGSVRWFTRVGSGSTDNAYELAVGTTGTIFITGRVGRSSFNFGFGERTNPRATSLSFLLGVQASDGTLMWDQAFSQPASVAPGPSGGVIVGTRPFGAQDLGGGSRDDLGGSGGDLHLVHYDASGAHVWDARHEGSGSLLDLDLASNGTVVVASGGYFGSVNLGGGTDYAAMGRDYFIAAYSVADGSNSWVFANPSEGDQSASGAALDDSGTVFATGRNSGTIAFGGGRTHVATTATELWTLRLESTGSYGWHAIQQGTVSAFGESVAIEATGNPVFVGRFQGSVDLGGGSFFSTRMGMGFSGFVASYRASDGGYLGDEIFSSGPESRSGVYFKDVAVGPGGTRVIVGSFNGSANFGLGLRMSNSFDVVTVRQAP